VLLQLWLLLDPTFPHVLSGRSCCIVQRGPIWLYSLCELQVDVPLELLPVGQQRAMLQADSDIRAFADEDDEVIPRRYVHVP